MSDSQNLAGKWQVTHLNGEVIVAGGEIVRPSLLITERMEVSGNAGCNNFIGRAEYEAGSFRIPHMGMTMMFCAMPAMDVESTFAGAMKSWSVVSFENETLYLDGPNGQVVLERF
ncbi:hypothetical protein A6E01_20525 (plasmid) [Vibrio breoganii]|uniref:DUF306 domain-containing protein n=2 Tax=Vibrio breoganii TaxID=553239 RepID=A0AAN1CUG4_9VIBR|nr:hypothetical protein A6E01_20525 [Vibrio breoganii]PML15865.1 hypothetical protein BCT84_07605 [Vibrio breoganii]